MGIKKKILLLLLCIMALPATTVFADSSDEYITNSNNVTVTRKEYDFIKQYYNEEFFNNMTLEDYKWLEKLNINDSEVEIVSINQPIIRGSLHSTSNKKLTIAKSCANICTIYVNATWLTNPSNRSFDVIGARYMNTSLAMDTIDTKVYSSVGTEYFSNTKKYSNGHGTSVKLPESATNIIIEQRFYVTTGGHLFASYQHSIKEITLATSISYTISSSGYGNVFNFYGDAVGSFDQMSGVDIAV